MDISNNEYDNSDVSKLPIQFFQFSGIVAGAIFGIPFFIFLMILVYFIDPSDVNQTSLIMGLLLYPIITGFIFLELIRRIYICPYKIAFTENEMIIYTKKMKANVNYKDIQSLYFSYFSYNHSRKLFPRWMVKWKNGSLIKKISLTENNAKHLANRLNDKGISYKWDESRRKLWKKRMKRYRLNDTPE